MTENQRQLISDLRELWACDDPALEADTYRDLLHEAEKDPAVRILWGLWTREELDARCN